jgi:hypothetical protein
MNARAEVLMVQAALSDPAIDQRLLWSAVGRLLLVIENQVYCVGVELDKLGARVDRLEAAARRPLLADAGAE